MDVESVINEIVKICIEMQAKDVYLYGSRAKGTNLERSDIDIAVRGSKYFELLQERIEQIPTLYVIDLLNLDRCRNQDLLEDIETYGRKIYEKIC